MQQQFPGYLLSISPGCYSEVHCIFFNYILRPLKSTVCAFQTYSRHRRVFVLGELILGDSVCKSFQWTQAERCGQIKGGVW